MEDEKEVLTYCTVSAVHSAKTSTSMYDPECEHTLHFSFGNSIATNIII
jgi:hypothetical protein